ncbi:5-formyltetrahydrofolate cyclo-ligase [Salirhabdus euzebyi]|uniref:5-formyltetrahydrofolate cyclo-ligase n=1 Tax=Salirhabdus euzebyi TaxID=394506 RepID=A0A841Q5X7_9BACI|nr:5-formyltetrahydrofolate cyclo-ligase [Salirhabdus euzebyi]MBB6453879.1 5-formyltetrahydrofolate cyclo-ligase [Salirhabdus euzebyi]
MKNKAEIREEIWDQLTEQKLGRFPFPLHGRIPNFKGSEIAAKYVTQLDVYKEAKVIKVNPDAPQLPLRAQAIKDGKIVLIPTPRLKAGFIEIRPENVPPGEERKATSLSNMKKYGQELALKDLPRVDLFVVGAVAVHQDGSRVGKGEGYADREYAILRELGNPEIPIITTVHSIQFIDEPFPADKFDIVSDWVATEKGIYKVETTRTKPEGIVWERVTEQERKDMPVLEEIWAIKEEGKSK